MERTKLEPIIDAIAKITPISPKKKEELLTRYETTSEKETIGDLSMISYQVLGKESELYDYALQVIRNIDKNNCPPIEEMKTRIEKRFNNEVEGNLSLVENHALINQALVDFTTKFNKSVVDYYIVGALPCFIKTGQPLFRYHDDIDIMVNEDDIPRIKEIVEQMGYRFDDDRFPTKERFLEMEKHKPPHTVLAQNPDNEFHLGFFCFKRNNDGGMTIREYSHRLVDGEVVTDVLERTTDALGTALRYDEQPTDYLETAFKTSTVESVYNIKEYTKRPKDRSDMLVLAPHLNQERLMALHQHQQTTTIKEAVSSPNKNISSQLKK